MAHALAGFWQADPDDEDQPDWEVSVDVEGSMVNLVAEEELDVDTAKDIAEALLSAVALIDRTWPN